MVPEPAHGRLRALLPGTVCAAAAAAAGLLARRHAAALEEVTPGIAAGAGATVDAVVPARDEAERIGGCVAALRAQGPGVGVTVVDDASADATGARAAAAGAEVLRLEGPPPGWLGKPHACAAGAAAGSAPWLAFVDADVTLAPGALAALVAAAERRGLAAVSPLLRQRGGGVADSLVVPLAFWQYTVGLPGGGQGGGRGILNGQCVVVRRDVYESSGGHADAGVRASVVEDSALARLLVGRGGRIALVRGEELGEVRMYRDAATLRAGFGRNAALFLAADPVRGLLVAASGLAMSAVLPLAVGALRPPRRVRLLGAALAWAPPVAALAPRYRAARLPAALALLHPVAASAMQLIAVESLVRGLLGRPPRWKGRRLR
ncbi:MAG TPA: glycosyltransferase family 2 protein [Candidatus Dormibacteraeota bacterium]